MAIWQKFKKVLRSDEAQELREEVVETTTEVYEKGKEVAHKAYEKGKDLVSGDDDEKGQGGGGAAAQEAKGPEVPEGKIDFDTFMQVDVRVGTILSVEKVEKSEKLLKLMVDLGEGEPRQIVSGIAPYFPNEQVLIERQAMFVANLAPRKIFGLESDGMIFALSDDTEFSILGPDMEIKNGTRAS